MRRGIEDESCPTTSPVKTVLPIFVEVAEPVTGAGAAPRTGAGAAARTGGYCDRPLIMTGVGEAGTRSGSEITTGTYAIFGGGQNCPDCHVFRARPLRPDATDPEARPGGEGLLVQVIVARLL